MGLAMGLEELEVTEVIVSDDSPSLVLSEGSGSPSYASEYVFWN